METRNTLAIFGARPRVLLEAQKPGGRSAEAQAALEVYLRMDPASRPSFTWGERGYRLVVRVDQVLSHQLTEERVRRVRSGLPDGLSDILHDALGVYLGVRPA